jgi:hypothetical protein
VSVRRYWSILTPPVQQRLMEVVGGTCNDLIAELRSPATVVAAIPIAREPHRLMGILRNGFRASVYLFSVAVQVAEKTYSPPPSGAAAGGAGGKGKVRCHGAVAAGCCCGHGCS